MEYTEWKKVYLTLSWRRPLSYRKQSIDLQQINGLVSIWYRPPPWNTKIIFKFFTFWFFKKTFDQIFFFIFYLQVLEKEEYSSNIFLLQSRYWAYKTSIGVNRMSEFDRRIDWADNIIKTETSIVLWLSTWVVLFM